MIKALRIVLILFLPMTTFGQDTPTESQSNALVFSEQIAEQVKENYDFHGMALYFNNVSAYLGNTNQLKAFNVNDAIDYGQWDWLAFVGRFKAKVIDLNQNPNKSEHLTNESLLQQLALKDDSALVLKSELSQANNGLDQLRYHHLWAPLALLAKVVEATLVQIHKTISSNWGIAILVFGVIVKIVLLPVVMLITKFERSISQVKAVLIPKLDEIKANYDGEEAHHRLMQAHKELGVTPFYTLKPMIGLVIQIPILIAIFNALGEMPQFEKQSFLWIDDLAYPDAVAKLPLTIPMFGELVSLLPFIMTAITLVSTYLFTNSYATASQNKKQKINLTLMAIVFFVLFYPFPAVMVLYWTVSNLLHIAQQQFLKI